MKLINATLSLVFTAMMALSCSSIDYDSSRSYEESFGSPSGIKTDGDGGQGNGSAGVVTAGEWNDLDNWCFWSGLINGQDYHSYQEKWGFYTNRRIPVTVRDEKGNPVAGAKVTFHPKSQNIGVWTATTDNSGNADCWNELFEPSLTQEIREYAISINGMMQEQAPKEYQFDTAAAVVRTVYTINQASIKKDLTQIAFIVDATGSMGDEIDYLKKDLRSIISRVEDDNTLAVETAALFYRDEGDDYVTRESNFSRDFSKTSEFIGKQNADGGGDYPEAVHIALENSLQKLSWNENAYSKIAFMLLDAPAHDGDKIRKSLQKSIKEYSAEGIRLIPIAASGADKSTEFMLRFFAIATGGTYVFITNDSGVGNDHIEASVGPYQVEKLNDLMVRLIKKYSE